MPKATFKIPLGSISNGWMPIETAPTDYTPILAVDKEGVYCGVVVFSAVEGWECVDMLGRPTGTGFYPTHWRPIPPPPETKE